MNYRALASREARLWPYAVALALIAVSAAGGAAAARIWSGGSMESPGTIGREAELAELVDQVDSLERLLTERQRALTALAGPAIRIVNLTNRGAQGRTLARMFWDPGTHHWSLFVYELRQPQPGRTYQVWIAERDRRLSAGTFNPGPDGTAFLEARREVSLRDFRFVAITEEPLGGAERPGGVAVLAGSVSP